MKREPINEVVINPLDTKAMKEVMSKPIKIEGKVVTGNDSPVIEAELVQEGNQVLPVSKIRKVYGQSTGHEKLFVIRVAIASKEKQIDKHRQELIKLKKDEKALSKLLDKVNDYL